MSFEDWLKEYAEDHPERFKPDVISVYGHASYSADFLNKLMKTAFYAGAEYGDYD